MSQTDHHYFSAFASLGWYDETIKFVFNFVAKTSEVLLAAGVVVSTANFLTDGDVMRTNRPLSDAWSWAQAIAIDSSLGVVFMNGCQAVRERDTIKATIYFTLTAILATVAGLLTHFDALSHAAGLSVTDKNVSGVIPLWILTALRAIAVVGFLLVSRLKNFSFHQLHQELSQEPQALAVQERASQILQIDYEALAAAILRATPKEESTTHADIQEEENVSVFLLPSEIATGTRTEAPVEMMEALTETVSHETRITLDEPADIRIAQAYQAIQAEKGNQQNQKLISARELAKRANVRRSTCSEWLQQHLLQE